MFLQDKLIIKKTKRFAIYRALSVIKISGYFDNYQFTFWPLVLAKSRHVMTLSLDNMIYHTQTRGLEDKGN